MNISYAKSKSLKDIETKFKKYPRTKKNRFTRYLINLFHTSDICTPPNKSISYVNCRGVRISDV